MKIRTKANILSLILVVALASTLLVAGSALIERILYQFYDRVLKLELATASQIIQKSLNRSGTRAAIQAAKAYQQSLHQHDETSGARLVIVESPGQRAVYYPDHQYGEHIDQPYVETLLEQERGTIEISVNKVPHYGAFTTLQPIGWTIFLSVSTQNIIDSKYLFMKVLGGTTVFILGGYAFIIHLFSRDVLRRIENALTCVTRIEQGDLTARTEVRNTSDEVGALQAGINAMSARIEQRTHEQLMAENEVRELNRTLEKRVEERTKALSKANKTLSKTIDTLKKTQDDLVEAEKMSSLGSLVAGVAHEVNTPLGVCITTSSHQNEQIQKFDAAFHSGAIKKSDLNGFLESSKKSAEILQINLERAAQLIKSFKQVAVDQSSEAPREISLNTYLDEILSSLHPKLRKMTVTVSKDIPSDVIFKTYPGAIAQIFTNLVINSLIHGFKDNPSIEGNITISAQNAGDDVSITYSDDGQGMSASTRKKIFDPFFTTNRHQGGSGLGLHIVYNLVTQKLGGNIKCVSTKGQGTTFTLTIPQTCRLENSKSLADQESENVLHI